MCCTDLFFRRNKNYFLMTYMCCYYVHFRNNYIRKKSEVSTLISVSSPSYYRRLSENKQINKCTRIVYFIRITIDNWSLVTMFHFGDRYKRYDKDNLLFVIFIRTFFLLLSKSTISSIDKITRLIQNSHPTVAVVSITQNEWWSRWIYRQNEKEKKHLVSARFSFICVVHGRNLILLFLLFNATHNLLLI